MEQRAVVDRFGAVARRRSDRPAVLRHGWRDPGAGRHDLSARRFRLDARRAAAAALAWLEARIGIPGVPVGSLLRADDPLRAGDRVANASDSRRVLARL